MTSAPGSQMGSWLGDLEGRPSLLMKVILDPADPARWNAIRGLGRCGNEESLRYLVSLVGAKDFRLRFTAVGALDGHPLVAMAFPALLEALHDPADINGLIACRACAILAKAGCAEARPHFLELLRSANPATRAHALQALGRSWILENLDHVIRLSKDDPAKEVRTAAVDLLFACASEASWRVVFDLWRRDETPQRRMLACRLAARFNHEAVLEELGDLAKDSDGHVRKAAGRLLR